MFSINAFIACVAGSLVVQFSIAQAPTTGISELAPVKYKEIPLGSIRPKGWLRNQLEVMRSGTTGHLDEVYDKIMNDNGWLGGQGDGWEPAITETRDGGADDRSSGRPVLVDLDRVETVGEGVDKVGNHEHVSVSQVGGDVGEVLGAGQRDVGISQALEV